MVNNEEGNT